MTICKYFQQNRCRYGNNCRFEHDIGGGAQRQLRFDTGGGGGRDNNRYKWTAQNNNNNDNSESQTSPEELVSSLRHNMETWEQSKMWPFSCMALEKDQPCMPEFTDVSADELRWEAYQAIKSGNLMAYTEKVKQLTEEYRNKLMLLKHPTTEIKNQLIQFINNYRKNKKPDAKSSFVKPSAFGGSGSSSTGAFGGGMTSTSAAASTGFGGQSSSTNLFGGQSSFGGQPANSGDVFGGQSSFGAQNTTSATFGSSGSFGGQSSGSFGSQSNAGSIFSNAAKSSGFGNTPGSGSAIGQPATFGQTATSGSIFGQNPASTPGFGQSGSTAFGQPTQTSGFGQTAAPGSIFGQPQTTAPGAGIGQTQNPTRTLFGKPEPSPASGSIFGSSGFSGTSAFGTSAAPSGGSGIQGQTTSDNAKSTVYTPLDQLTADERAQFEAEQFTPGRIPVKPPPRELVK